MAVDYSKPLQNYELTHWRAHKGEDYDRAEIMRGMFSEWPSGLVAADVGSGPHGGVFNAVQYETMVAIDPLWGEYQKEGLGTQPDGVSCLCASAETFTLPHKADVIFSFNALDHSGDLKSSFDNIMVNLVSGGQFLFHIHMRTPKQLNAGHKMAITEQQLDDILAPYKTIEKRILDNCPLDKKPYRSYIARVTHAD